MQKENIWNVVCEINRGLLSVRGPSLNEVDRPPPYPQLTTNLGVQCAEPTMYTSAYVYVFRLLVFDRVFGEGLGSLIQVVLHDDDGGVGVLHSLICGALASGDGLST
jgi:hypothetical protein